MTDSSSVVSNHSAPVSPSASSENVREICDLSGNFEPRTYQSRIVQKAVELFLHENLRSILIDSPTGSGKTLMGLLIARAMSQACGLRVGWAAMRRNLLTQAAHENEQHGIRVACHWISMFDRSPPGELDMLVVDEAQHDAAASMAHLHSLLRPRFILGLTATPFRSDRVQLCFDTVIRDASIQRLIQDGYLSRFHHYTIPEYLPSAVVAHYASQPERWGKSILYFHTLQQCSEAQRLFTERGFRAEVVSGDSDREAQIEAFRRGEIQLLVNCLLLGEGFDCPDLQTVFCRPSGRGVAVQTCGRVLRMHPASPVKNIVQCQRTRWPFARTARPAGQFLWSTDGWRSLQANEHVSEISSRMLHALASTEVNLPNYLTRRQAGTRPARRIRTAD